jgi:DNA-binding transcriptional LysR family regulator
MPISFSQLAAFRAVADAGSVGRGAEKLLVSQPAVSKHIRQLERQLGVTLFDRTPRGVRATAAGEMLADYARRIFALVDEAEQAVADLRGLRRGKLAIAASPTLGVYFLPELLVRFRRRFQNVALSVEVENSRVLQRRLLDGDVELGFSEVQPPQREIESHVFMHDKLIAVASPRHAMAKKRGIALAALCREPFVVRETGSTTKSMVERALTARGLSITPVMSLGSTEAIKHAVAGGIGVAIIARLAAAPDLATRRLVQLNVKDLALRRPLYRLNLRGRRQSAAAGAFLELVAAAAKEPAKSRDESAMVSAPAGRRFR